MSRFPLLVLSLLMALGSSGCQWLQQSMAPPSPAPTGERPARPEGPRVYVSDKDSYVVAIRTSDDTPAEKFPVEHGAGGVALSPDGLYLYASAKTQDYVRVFQTTGIPVGRLNTGREPAGMVMSRDGKRLYVANKGSDSVTVLDLESRKTVVTFPSGHQPALVALSCDEKRLYVLAHKDNLVIACAPDSGQEAARAQVPPGAFGLAVDPGGRFLYVSSFDGNDVSVLDATTLALVSTVKVGDGAYDVVAAESGKVYVACVEDSSVVTFSRDDLSAEPLATPVGARPYGLALSPDQSKLYIALEGDNKLGIRSLPGLEEKPALDLGVTPVDVFTGP